MKIITFAACAAGLIFLAAFVFPKKSEMANTAAMPTVFSTENSFEKNIPGQPEELGDVHWLRDFDAGILEAKKSDKPILILFQEVPGCSNCTKFGNEILRHPLIVEAIETFFVPVCIFNNKKGKDSEVLFRFNEPSWNNPVVRIVRPDGLDVVPRMADFRSTWQVVNGIRTALNLTATPCPEYLQSFENELLARENGLETATFSMNCFWSGEKTIGSIEGVVETEPGFQNGKEVVRAVFNPAIVKRADLEKKVTSNGINSCPKNEGFRPDDEPKYYLSKTFWQFVPMTPLQQTRANSAVGKNLSPENLLSPRQLALADFVKNHPEKKWPSAIGKEIIEAWAAAKKIEISK